MGTLTLTRSIRRIRTYVGGCRVRGAQDARSAYPICEGERFAIPQADRELLPNGSHLTRVRPVHISHSFVELIRGVQVGDDGTMYTSICQGRALRVLRVGEVVTGCVCITRRLCTRR